jgi:hypothetical protein
MLSTGGYVEFYDVKSSMVRTCLSRNMDT